MRRRGRHGFNKKAYIISLIVLVPVICIMGVYIYGINRYKSCFVNGTVIDKIDVSGMTIPQFTRRVDEYVLKVEQKRPDGSSLVEEIKGADIGLSYASIEPFEEVLENQNNFLWFIRQETEQNPDIAITYDEKALETKVNSLSGFSKDLTVEPTNAYLSEYIPQVGFRIVQETSGNMLDRQKTLEAICAAVDGLEEYISLEAAQCYETAEITSENEELKSAFETLQRYADTTITYDFGGKQETLDGAEIVSWLQAGDSGITLDENKVKEYVEYLRKNYNTVFKKRTFKTSYNMDITVDKGDYGWWIDTAQEAKELADMINKGESGERTPVYRQTAAAHDMPDYGDTYVEINLTKQHLLLYIDGKKVLESDFVSGNSASGFDTPAGIYGITYKQRDATLNGEGYSTPVSYWMPFNNNVGMHDAKWRKAFGGDIYKKNGSHGCINLPYDIAEEIYGHMEKGTPVICYYMPGTEPGTEDDKEDAPETEQSKTEQSEAVPEQPGAVPEQPEQIPVPVEPLPVPTPEVGVVPVQPEAGTN